MKKNKKQVNNLEVIDNYLNTNNEHYNNHALELYNEAEAGSLFKDVVIPLRFFSEYISILHTHKTKPLQVVAQLMNKMSTEKFNKEQQVFILKHLANWFRGTEFTDANSKKYSLNNIADFLKKEIDKLQPVKNENKNPFDWSEAKKHIETLPDTKAKIKYLIEQKTKYNQQDGWNFDMSPTFADKCELEIKQLKDIAAIETPAQTKVKPQFQLSNKKGARIDLIRILNAIYELRMIENPKGEIPSKEIFMKQAGEFFGTDFSKYDTDLSQAMNNGTVETNLKIFEDMKTVTQRKVLADKKK